MCVFQCVLRCVFVIECIEFGKSVCACVCMCVCRGVLKCVCLGDHVPLSLCDQVFMFLRHYL